MDSHRPPVSTPGYWEGLYAGGQDGWSCFFPLREGDDGPPFPVSRADVERALAGRFTVLEAGPPPRSVERRRGLEWLVCARREPLPRRGHPPETSDR